MKKLFMKLAIWYLNKCQVQPIELECGKHLLINGKLFQISYYGVTKSWEDETVDFSAKLVF